MTIEEQKRHEQQLETNIRLDFTAWSARERRAGKPHDHASWQSVRDAAIFDSKWENAKARSEYLATLAEKKAVEERKHQREIDAELLPQKQRLMRQWLADNPTFTEADFETKAWIHLRQNLIEERTDAARAAELKRQLSTFRY
jgi:hypothetical protein